MSIEETQEERIRRYNDEKQQRIEAWLTPSEEEQVIRILQGKCPHNKGWKYYCGGHNDDAYTCAICGEMDYY